MNNYLKKQVSKSEAIKKQFVSTNNKMPSDTFCSNDPLREEDYKVMPGLINKYNNRVLIELTLNCAAYCLFCTRKRKVNGLGEDVLSNKEIDNISEYINENTAISEVIISGGDPFFKPESLIYLLKKLSQTRSVKIIRIHTRLPVSNPDLVSSNIFRELKKIKKQALYISIHFEHFDELTIKTKKVIKKLIESGATLLSQTVFLKNINDDVEILKKLFSKLAELKIRPYYIYRCDPVVGAENYIVPFEKEVEIMTQLRKELSGIACPTYVIDAPDGSGKIPVPLNFWGKPKRGFRDFSNKNIQVIGP